MKAKDVQIGKKVIYHPVIGRREGKVTTITSGVYEICGTECCMVSDVSGCVAIEALEEVA